MCFFKILTSNFEKNHSDLCINIRRKFLNLKNRLGSIFWCKYYFRLTHCFKIDQKTFMGLNLEALGKLSSFGTKLKPLFVNFFLFLFEWFFLLKNTEFWEIYFLTKFFLESIKMNLHTIYAPFWNEINVNNLLILSNF